MQYVVLTELGMVILDGKKCVRSFPFRDPASEYIDAKSGRGMDELAGHLESSSGGLAVSHREIYDSLNIENVYMQMMGEAELEEIQSSKPQILVDAGFAESVEDAASKLRDFAVQMSSLKVAETSGSPDLHMIQAINALDEIDRDINVTGARVKEWYGLHFPELENVMDSIGGYARVAMAGRRDSLDADAFRSAGIPEERIEMLTVVSERSRGGEISDGSLEVVQTLARQVVESYKLRVRVEEHVGEVMRREAPNVTAVLGASVGARMLAKAGSLKKLAMMPSSTIQILGAEKALFRSIKTGSHPPKHGLIFQHALVHAAPRWQRGRIARTIAAKTAIAARVDLHGAGLNETLLEKLNLRIREIGEKSEPGSRPKGTARRRERPVDEPEQSDLVEEQDDGSVEEQDDGSVEEQAGGSVEEQAGGSVEEQSSPGEEGRTSREDRHPSEDSRDSGGKDRGHRKEKRGSKIEHRSYRGEQRDARRKQFGSRDGYRGSREGYRGSRDGYRGSRDEERGSRDGYRGSRESDRGNPGTATGVLERVTVDPGTATGVLERVTVDPGTATGVLERVTVVPGTATGVLERATVVPGRATVDREIATGVLERATVDREIATGVLEMATVDRGRVTVVPGMATGVSGRASVDQGTATVDRGTSREVLEMATVDRGRATVVRGTSREVLGMATVDRGTSREVLGWLPWFKEGDRGSKDEQRGSRDGYRGSKPTSSAVPRRSIAATGRRTQRRSPERGLTGDKGFFRIRFRGELRLATENLVPGNRVYNERLVIRKGVEYRTWEPHRSKLAAALNNGLRWFPFSNGMSVLYLGASTGTTVSHISDIVGPGGRIFAVEHTSRVARELLDRVASHRRNVTPVLQDARNPREYLGVFGKVDTAYSDIAQPDQTEIALANCGAYLKPGGILLLIIKSRSIDSVSSPRRVIENETAKLHDRFQVLQTVDLEPYAKDHVMIVARNTPENP